MNEYVMSARQAYDALRSPLPEFKAAAEKALKAGAVRPVYIAEGDKVPPKYAAFLKQYKLISSTPVQGARRSGGGNILEIRKAVGNELVDAFLAALHKLEDAMQAKGVPFEIQVAYKSAAVQK